MSPPRRAYIGVNGVTYFELAPVLKITITRREGPQKRIDIPRHAYNWFDAKWILYSEATTAPEGGGYDKHDFEITWEGGATYSGRYDLTRWDSGDLAGHVRSFLQWCVTHDHNVETARTMLNTLDIHQDPIRVPEGTVVEIVKDYRNV